MDHPIPVAIMMVNAVEAFSVGEELFLVLEDDVQAISIRALAGSSAGAISVVPGEANGRGTILRPRFDERTPIVSEMILDTPSRIDITYATAS